MTTFQETVQAISIGGFIVLVAMAIGLLGRYINNQRECSKFKSILHKRYDQELIANQDGITEDINSLRIENARWARANATGGWIDNLRQELKAFKDSAQHQEAENARNLADGLQKQLRELEDSNIALQRHIDDLETSEAQEITELKKQIEILKEALAATNASIAAMRG